MLILGLLFVSGAWAQEKVTLLPAAGDGTLFWLLKPMPSEPKTASPDDQTKTRPPYQVLIHHTQRDDETHWQKVTQVNGNVQPASLAAKGNSLYAVFGSSRVYRIDRQNASSNTILTDLVKLHVQLNLPVAGTVLSSFANDSGYHVILEPEMTVERLAAETVTPQDTRLLMTLSRGKWTQQPLPEAVLDLKQIQLIGVGKDKVIGFVGINNGKLACVTKPRDTWSAQTLDLSLDDQIPLQWLNIQGHVVVTQIHGDLKTNPIKLHLIVGDQVLKLGSFEFSSGFSALWPALVIKDKIGLVLFRRNKELATELYFQSMDLQGNELEEPVLITIGDPNDVLNQPGRLVVSLALMLAVMVMFSVWRRDPANARVTVPEGYQIAGISKRFLALMIDLSPCGIISSWLCGITLEQLVDQWPGVAITWEQLIPGLITIALFTTHTTVTEVFTAQTLGKKIMGISVCTMAGQSPDVWQVILRNLLKVLDLIAWYVLPMLVIVSAYRQRLGDVVARTVVIQPKRQEIDE